MCSVLSNISNHFCNLLVQRAILRPLHLVAREEYNLLEKIHPGNGKNKAQKPNSK